MDRRTRKNDSMEEGKMETVHGTFKYTGHNLHEYSIPNDHYRGIFENICPEDFANYWNFNNKHENTKGYFKMFNQYSQNTGNSDLVQDFNSNEIVFEGLKESDINTNVMLSKQLKWLFGLGCLLSSTSACI